VPRDRDIHTELRRQPLGEGALKSFGDVLDERNPDFGSASKSGQQLARGSRPTCGRSNRDVSKLTADDGRVVRLGHCRLPIP
jgi:hypothetical protein